MMQSLEIQNLGPYQSVASGIRDASSITLACISSLGSVKRRAHRTMPKASYHLQTFIPRFLSLSTLVMPSGIT